MKELIHLLSNLTTEQINHLSLEEATSCIDKFDNLAKAATGIWDLFKLVAIDKRDRQILEVMHKHADGVVINEITKLQTLSHSLFSADRPLIIKTTAVAEMNQFKEMAENYLEYHKHKTTLDANQSLITERLEALNHKESSSFKMQ